jgi:predicted O-methyltransferase YrrM
VNSLRYEDVSRYVEGFVGDGGSLFTWAYGKSLELGPEGVVPVDPPRGRFLELVARMTRPRKILEIGSGAGYSALWFLKGASKTARLDIVEINPRVEREFERVMRRVGHWKRVRVHSGPALKVLPHLKGFYDCVFIDADKDEYPDYLRHALRLTRPGSIIVADNLLWGGSVLGNQQREGARSIHEYTGMIFKDKRLSSLIIPLGDGLALSFRVK